MRERHWLYFGLELLLSAASLFAGYSSFDLISLIVCSLILACLLTAKLLAKLLNGPQVVAWLAAAGALVTLLVFCPQVILPLFVVLLVDIIGERTEQQYAIALVLIASILVSIALSQLPWALVLAAIGLVAAAWGTYLLQKLHTTRSLLSQKDARVALLETQLTSQRETISAIEQQGRQAERNRLAARIHDQIGHGVTGSVLMLEAALIQLDKHPEAARTSIAQVTENLRSSVDGIRAELREERSAHDEASLAKIAEELTRFESEHSSIKTVLLVDGALEQISQTVWVCISETLRETLTNLLKHSNATLFTVHITLKNRLVYAEFSDNGGAGGSAAGSLEVGGLRSGSSGAPNTADQKIVAGIGLQSIEERCLLCGGKCFFDLTPQGFTTKMTFTLKENASSL
jgi:signal transduction histidine kinase